MAYSLLDYLENIYNMNYFVNAFEYSDTQGGTYHTYRLYSGSSEEEIKGILLSDLQDTWMDVSDVIDNLKNSPSLSLDAIAKIFNEKLEEEGYGYDLKISEPYTDTNVALDFYGDYEDDKKLHADHEVGFYSYGDHSIRIVSLFSYLSSMRTDFKVLVPENLINRLLDMVGL
jgi:hypothetical protein